MDNPEEEIARLRAELVRANSKPPVIAQKVREALLLAAEMVETQIGGLQDIAHGLREVAEHPTIRRNP